MKKHTLLAASLMGVLVWSPLQVSSASAAEIAHLKADGTPEAGSPTITILDSGNRDITATWLPEPDQPVTIRVNGATVNTLTLSSTSRYPGTCTNYGTGATDDFSWNEAIKQLTSTDCGGTATLLLNNSVSFKLPQDSNNNNIPDIWENPRGGSLIANQDRDLSPSTTDAQPAPATEPPPDPNCVGECRRGDGISIFDEYRGFIVSNADRTAGVPLAGSMDYKHIRTEPTSKDLFVHIVNGQCAPATPPAIHGTFLRYFPAAGTPDLFAFAYTLLPGTQIHLLDYKPGVANPTKSTLWEDFFDSYTLTDPDGTGPLTSGMVFRTAADVRANNESAVPTDRQINKNVVFPITNVITNTTIQKGIRLIECQVVDSSTVFGISPWGTPNKVASQFGTYAGSAVVFTERVRKDIQTKITNSGVRRLIWAVWNVTTNEWVQQTPDLARNQGTEDFLAARQIQYLFGHEITHAARLRPTTTNGYHSVSGSGSMMDASMKLTQDKTNSTSKKTILHIPSQYLTSDQQEIRFGN